MHGERAGRLFVVPVINAMGPVIDARHNDLLPTWEAVDRALETACRDDYRMRFPDSAGRGVTLSFFCISWSGFELNPVKRHFGWHTIFDHYRDVFGEKLTCWGDDFYWMYNHPPELGVGNEWGLDWLHNSHYYDILNHFVIDRGYYPACVEVPTERNDASLVLEDLIPFDFGNRNAPTNDLASINADGRTTGTVIDWRRAPHDWSHYHPHRDDYQRAGGTLDRAVFRIVDIKSIIHVLSEAEIVRAFERCLEGKDTVLCAYEHDFRDRYQTILDLMIEPVYKVAQRVPEVEVIYSNARDAAKAVLGFDEDKPPMLSLVEHREGFRVHSDKPLFGTGPYFVIFDEQRNSYLHLPLARLGTQEWRVPSVAFPSSGTLGLAGHDLHGNTGVTRYDIKDGAIGAVLKPGTRPDGSPVDPSHEEVISGS